MAELLRITPKDNVAVALSVIEEGVTIEVDGITVTTLTSIPAGHKVALEDIPQGEKVIKYGFPIGYAKSDVKKGGHIHVQNLHTLLSGELEYEYHPTFPTVEAKEPATFMGYPRKDGRVGVRNELRILPTVGCVNDIVRELEKDAQSLVGGGVEVVNAFPIPTAAPRWAMIRRTPVRFWPTWLPIPMWAACWCWVWAARTLPPPSWNSTWATMTSPACASWSARTWRTSMPRP